jgi:all-trans-retinol 13,14-reductase
MEMLKDRILDTCHEFDGEIEIIDGATPLTLRDFSNSPAGSLYGAKHRVGQYNPMSGTRIGGLYLIGQSIVAPGVLGAVISAFLACGSILGHDRLRKELTACR